MAGLHARFAHRFGRSEPRERAPDYLHGLVAPLERKNGWTLSEQIGQLRPDGVQRLLNLSDWDEDAVRDDVRDFVVETIGSPDGVLICDDTGFLKKGSRSAGVQRQYTGTAVGPQQLGCESTCCTAAGQLTDELDRAGVGDVVADGVAERSDGIVDGLLPMVLELSFLDPAVTSGAGSAFEASTSK